MRNKEEPADTSKRQNDENDAYSRVTIDRLLPGDVLLHCSASPTKVQKEIIKRTSGPYIHASIYLGDKFIAEACLPKIQKVCLVSPKKEEGHIAVLRHQLGFDGPRPGKLLQFIEALIANGSRYDVRGAIKNPSEHQRFFDQYLGNIEKGYGISQTTDELEKRSYFCSALVVACLHVAGVIGESAQVAYPPDVFSPSDLLSDPTFGWLLGFIHADDYIVPTDDPARKITNWMDVQNASWWS